MVWYERCVFRIDFPSDFRNVDWRHVQSIIMQCTSWCTSDKHNPACSVIIDNMSAIYHRRSDWFGQGWSASNLIWSDDIITNFDAGLKIRSGAGESEALTLCEGEGRNHWYWKIWFFMFFMVIFPRFFRADAFERNSKKTKTAWSKEGTDENAIGEENMWKDILVCIS